MCTHTHKTNWDSEHPQDEPDEVKGGHWDQQQAKRGEELASVETLWIWGSTSWAAAKTEG